MTGQGHDVTPETWDSMIPHVLENVSQAGRKTLHDATRPTQSTNQFFSLGVDEMESWTLQFLSSLANSPGWEDTISLMNEHHQTLAHLAVIFRYTALLKKVTQWGIDVDVQDVNGFTALHCAYLCGDLDSVRVLKGYGADEDIEDTLGRRPLDMYIQSTDNLGESSPSSACTSSSAQVPSTREEWEMISMASSEPGSWSDNESPMDLPASRDEPPHCESTTGTRIIAASVPISSSVCGDSFITDEGGRVDGVSELDLSDSSVSLEHSLSSTRVHNAPATKLQQATSHKQEPQSLSGQSNTEQLDQPIALPPAGESSPNHPRTTNVPLQTQRPKALWPPKITLRINTIAA